jgi:hypothetical protein
MNDLELIFSMLGDASTTKIARNKYDIWSKWNGNGQKQTDEAVTPHY